MLTWIQERPGEAADVRVATTASILGQPRTKLGIVTWIQRPPLILIFGKLLHQQPLLYITSKWMAFVIWEREICDYLGIDDVITNGPGCESCSHNYKTASTLNNMTSSYQTPYVYHEKLSLDAPYFTAQGVMWEVWVHVLILSTIPKDSLGRLSRTAKLGTSLPGDAENIILQQDLIEIHSFLMTMNLLFGNKSYRLGY